MSDNFFNTPVTRMMGMAVLVLTAVALGTYSFLNLEKVKHLDPSPAMINVSGEGEVLAVPDIGSFSFSVRSESDKADEAQKFSGEKINQILAYLRDQGVEEKDIKVVAYNLYPRWRYESVPCQSGFNCPAGQPVADGFEVNQTIRVKVRDTASATTLIAGVGERGATDLGELSFTVDDEDRLQDEAVKLAISDAQVRAELLAEQLGVRLVRMVSFYQEDNLGYLSASKTMVSDTVESAGFSGAELPKGESSTKAKVVVTYEVR